MIVVTGAAGFIGSNLAKRLNDAGNDQLVLVDWLGAGSKWRNIADLRYVDIIFPEQLPEFLAANVNSIQTIFHLGANCSTKATDGDAILRMNVHPSIALWRWCTEHSKTFIYASSAATYGDGSDGFDDDRDLSRLERLKPLNLYGWSKHTFDVWAMKRHAEGAAPPRWAGLKFFNVYGPREDHKADMMSIVSRNFDRLQRSETIHLFRSHHPDFRDGEQVRDFVYVGDCANVLCHMMNVPALGGIFNIGTGQPRCFRDLIGALATAVGARPQIEYIDIPADVRDNYQYYTCATTKRLNAIGYQRPFLSIEDGTLAFARAKGLCS